jgi:hypothetical protein
MRESRIFLQEHAGKWQVLTSGEIRRLERKENQMKAELIQRRKQKFGKAGSRKLTVMEEVILKNQTKKLSE